MRQKAKRSTVASVPAHSTTSPASIFSLAQDPVILAAALFFFTLLVYWPSFSAGYIWDDHLMVGNRLVNNGWPGLQDIWTTTKYPDFCPLTATSFWLEAQLGGATVAVRHATNIFLQGCNVAMVWLVLRRLKISGAWIAAAIFAAHPLCVTSTTWVAERKNTLSMFFYLLSFLFFLRSEKTEEAKTTSHFRQGTYWFSFLCYVAALLSKTSTVILPVALLLCAWWWSGKISRPNVWRVIPFFGIAFAAGGTTLFAHYVFGDKTIAYDALLPRLLGGTRAIWFYFSKAFAPVNLTMHYPRWEIDPHSVSSYLPVLGVLTAFAVGWRFRQTWGKALLFGLGYFVLALSPTLGIAKMTFLKFSQVADHFQFLALPGLIALVVGGICHLAKRKTVSKSRLHFCQAFLLFGFVPMLVVLSLKHQRIVSDAKTLWLDNIEKNPKAWIAHYGMATTFEKRGQFVEAEAYYRKAIVVRPNYLEALSNLGVLLGRQGRWTEVMDCYQKALLFEPTGAMLHFNLGTALLSQNRFVEAVGPLTKAVELNPNFSRFRNNLASVLMKTGKQEEAFQHVREAIRLEPTNDEAQANFGLMLFQIGKTREAIEQFQNALRFNPANVQAHYRLATVLVTLNKNDEALSHLASVVQLQPNYLLAHVGMAEILKRQGKMQEAAVHQAMANSLRERNSSNTSGER